MIWLPFAFFTHHKALVVSQTAPRTAPFASPRWETTIEPLMLDKQTVFMPQTVTPKHTHGRVFANITTADCRQL